MRYVLISSLLLALLPAMPVQARQKTRSQASPQRPAPPAEPEQKTLNEKTGTARKKGDAKDGGADATAAKEPLDPGKMQVPPSGASFFVGRIGQNFNRFSLLLSDASGRTVTRSFSERQMGIFEAVLKEARRFAETEESVGTAKPIITRFIDRAEPDFMVDVEKHGPYSKFYVTLTGLQGRLTVDAGTIQRGGTPEVEPLYFKIIERVLMRGAETTGSRRQL